ncbi:MAG: hypothetical protein WAN63_13375 [Candidatus Sulfotelmatobacter sp.]
MTRYRQMTRGKAIAVSFVAALAAACVVSANADTTPPSDLDPASCLQLVRSAVANEVAATNDNSKHMFHSRRQTPQGSQTRLYVETREAMAGMTISYNDKPLSPDQLEGEKNRLAGLASSPEQLRRKRSQEQENADRTLRIVKELPNAFLYQYDGEESGTTALGEPGVRLVRLKFTPNPAYQPPSRIELVLVGMQGVLVVDPAARRIALIDGTLFKEVSFGWGILGHLDKGGHFLVEQRDVGNRCWEVSHMSLSLTGKILLFKNLSYKSDEVFSDFRSVPPNTTFAQGGQMLTEEEAQLAQNRSSVTLKSQSPPQ